MTASKARKNRRLEKRSNEIMEDSGMPLHIGFLPDQLISSNYDSTLANYVKYFRMKAYSEALTRVKWTGLEEHGIDERYLETILYLTGQANIYHIGGEYLAGRPAPTEKWDAQANWQKWSAIGADGTYVNNQNNQNGVIIYDNDCRIPTPGLLDILIQDAAHAMTTASANMIQQRYAVFISGSSKQAKDVKKISRSLGMGEVGGVMNSDTSPMSNIGIEMLKPEVEDKTSIAFKAKTEYLNEIHAFLGTDHIPYEKKERLVSSEAEVFEESVIRQRNFYLRPRQKAAEQLNKLFGWQIEVTWNSAPMKDSNLMERGEGSEEPTNDTGL